MSPLAQDLSHLPRAERAEGEGLMPDKSPRFVGVLAEAWAAVHSEDKPTAGGTRFRHSDAGKCARAISYTAAGIPKSDPMDLTGVWNTTLGKLLHEAWQDALCERFPDAEVEVKVGWDDLDGSGHIDAVIRTEARCPCVDAGPRYSNLGPDHDGSPDECPDCDQGVRPWIVAMELKTIGGFGFKAAVGKARRGTPAEGPKTDHILQGALNALAVDADELVIGYLAKECISVNAGRDLTELGRFAAEWTFARADFEPLALEEKRRINGILSLVDKGELAARKVPHDLPPGAEIVDPLRSLWEVHDPVGTIADTGTLWNGSFCEYCAFQTLCSTTPSGRIPISSVAAALDGAA